MRIIAEVDGRLQELQAYAFQGEDELQDLLEHYPGLVLAAFPDDESVQVWTIGREVPVRAGSIDLVLLDSTGRVWVVEVKLAKNPEVRKQVVGQVLAYCADVARWARDDLEAYADQYLETRGTSLVELIDGEPDAVADLLDTAEGRLSRGDVIGLVVVDELNAVLQGVVDFVNGHASFGLLALKVEVVPHAEGRLFIPTVIGLTKRDRPTRGRATFGEALVDTDRALADAWEMIQSLTASEGWIVEQKKKIAECRTTDDHKVFWFSPAWRNVQMHLGSLVDAGFGDEVGQVLAVLDEVAGEPVTRRSPTVSVEALVSNWDRFLDAVRLVAELRVEAASDAAREVSS